MSGGHFEYRDYILNEFADKLEEDIREATSPRPEKIMFHAVSIYLKRDESCWSYINTPNLISTDAAIRWLEQNENCKVEKLQKVNEYRCGNSLYYIKEYDYWDYLDHEWRLELKPETIKIFEETIKELHALREKLHDIDYVMSGDSSEDDLIETYGKTKSGLEGYEAPFRIDTEEDNSNVYNINLH